jgi:hypothetical protein
VSADSQSDVDLEVAHVLFLDVVGYSKLLINEQAEVIAQLNQIVRATDHFRRAEAANKLIRIPTGDGMALAFFNSPEAPVQCAIEICRGKVMTVRYEAVNAMLLNEFLKEHRKVEGQQATITRLESKVAKQELTATHQHKQIEDLSATVQKVSEKLELTKAAPQLVNNH